MRNVPFALFKRLHFNQIWRNNHWPEQMKLVCRTLNLISFHQRNHPDTGCLFLEIFEEKFTVRIHTDQAKPCVLDMPTRLGNRSAVPNNCLFVVTFWFKRIYFVCNQEHLVVISLKPFDDENQRSVLFISCIDEHDLFWFKWYHPHTESISIFLDLLSSNLFHFTWVCRVFFSSLPNTKKQNSLNGNVLFILNHKSVISYEFVWNLLFCWLQLDSGELNSSCIDANQFN